MAFKPKSIFFLFILILSMTMLKQSESVSDIHDLFPVFGLPKGLLPNAVKSYSLSPDGSFEIELTRTCYVKFDVLVYYDKAIKGKLSYGSVSDISGIQAKELFLWVTVTGMDVEKNSDMIEFHVGALSRKLPAEQFETIPECRSKASSQSQSDSDSDSDSYSDSDSGSESDSDSESESESVDI